jgi:hypothetical protein
MLSCFPLASAPTATNGPPTTFNPPNAFYLISSIVIAHSLGLIVSIDLY